MEMSSNNELCHASFNTMWTENLSTLSLGMNNIQNETESQNNEPVNYGFIDDKAIRMMAKMGFQTGTGLGKNSQGIIQHVELQTNLGRRGLGYYIKGLEHANLQWDFSLEEITVEEKADWLIYSEETCDKNTNYLQNDDIYSWIKLGEKKTTISDETKYCDPHLLTEVLKAKEVFDELDPLELCKARSRANPFETLRSAFYMNRAALKMANIDAATDFMFSDVDRQKEHKQSSRPYYFADICAGPGGFSEYVLWRKRWALKGFGLTLRGEHDFKLHESTCAASETFEALYGARDDGDVYYPENIKDFCGKVNHWTDGVHFVMADGGFSVEGQENIQEVLSRQIYVCQCLIALNILREHGHFVIKLFDLFTPFSVGLIYLMRRCFRKIAILKPNSSRPANSERYLICSKLRDNSKTTIIRKYIEKIVQILYEIRTASQSDLDVLEIVPEHIIQADEAFVKYITESNNRLADKQIIGLLKLATFCRDPTLCEQRQEELRKQCLAYWRVPDKLRTPLPHITTDELLTSSILDTDFMFSYAKDLLKKEELNEILDESEDWHCTFLATAKKCNLCNIYAGLGRNRVYRFQRNRWVKVKNVELVRGTILFAELVKEFSRDDELASKKTLHIIDALRLGDISIADLPYHERLDLIGVYCQAVNRESRCELASLRVKPVLQLPDLTLKYLPTINDNAEWLYSLTSVNCMPSPYYQVNSLLFLKTDSSQSFDTSISSRVIIHLPNIFDFQNKNESDRLSIWEYFTNCLKSKK